MSEPIFASNDVAATFAVGVIEVPRESYHAQSKTAMRVASKKKGGPSYVGPQRLFYPRWKHIQTFYIFEMSKHNYYLAQSLTHHPHYSLLRSEVDDFNEALTAFQTKHGESFSIHRISSKENYFDNFLLVLNDFDNLPTINEFIHRMDNTLLLSDVVSTAKLDNNRGNFKIDCGYSSGQNLERDVDDYGVTRPRLLERTRQPIYLEIQLQLGTLLDMICDHFSLPKYNRVDDLHLKFANKIQPGGLIAAWRTAVLSNDAVLEVHEDYLNDPHELMSPVGVLSCIYQTPQGPLRLTKIGYSRQSLQDAVRRETHIKPVVVEFKQWEQQQPPLLRNVSSDLLRQQPNSRIPGVYELPCHLERCVGVSPYIHSIMNVQIFLQLTRHQCVAILYHSITNESPYFFYSICEKILAFNQKSIETISKLSPANLGIWFHDQMWALMDYNKKKTQKLVVPRRHQPHNGRRPSDLKIELSILNLIRLVDEYSFLDGKESKKQYYHSKAIAILMLSPEAGGCHACGGLTSQTLLYVLGCLGIIPMSATRWGELANTATLAFLEREYDLLQANGRAEQFLSACVASSPGSTHEQIENRICKWLRSKKQMKPTLKYRRKKNINNSQKYKQSKKKLPFKDGIWPGQRIFQPIGDKLHVWDANNSYIIEPPALSWTHIRGKRSFPATNYWAQSTRSTKKKVIGGNRTPNFRRVKDSSKANHIATPGNMKVKKARLMDVTYLSPTQVIMLLPNFLEVAFQAYCPPLYLSLNNLLGSMMGEANAVSNKRIVTETHGKGKFYSLKILDAGLTCVTYHHYQKRYTFARDCRTDGILDMARTLHPNILAKTLSRLLQSPAVERQLAGPNSQGRTNTIWSTAAMDEPNVGVWCLGC